MPCSTHFASTFGSSAVRSQNVQPLKPGAVWLESIAGGRTAHSTPHALTSGSATKVYDGTPLRNIGDPTVGGDGFVEGEGASYTFFASLTDVGGMENLFDYTLNEGTKAGNYAITKEYGWLRVTPAKLDTAPIGESASYTLPYDGARARPGLPGLCPP